MFRYHPLTAPVVSHEKEYPRHTHTHTTPHTRVCVRIHTYTNIHTNLPINKNTHPPIPTHAHAHTHASTRARTGAYTRARSFMPAYPPIITPTRTHTLTRTHAHRSGQVLGHFFPRRSDRCWGSHGVLWRSHPQQQRQLCGKVRERLHLQRRHVCGGLLLLGKHGLVHGLQNSAYF